MRLNTKLLCAAAAAAALIACKRDLNVPSASTAPSIDGIDRASAYAGERVVISGSGFDPTPEGNLVQFARASARAESQGTTNKIPWIAVRVPADAGSGPFTVATKGGISSPFSSFTYRGLGELRTGVVTSEIPLLHKPYRVVAIEGDTFMHSDLLVGLLRYGDPSFVAAQGRSMDAAPWASPPSMVWLESDFVSTTSMLVRRAIGDPEIVTTAAIPEASMGPIVAMRGAGAIPDAVAVLRHDSSSPYGTTVALHDLADLAPLLGYGETDLPFEDLRGCADTGTGGLACLVRSEQGDDFERTPLTLALVSFDPALSANVLPPPGVPLVEDRNQLDDPLCVDTTRNQAVVALQDGTLAVADLVSQAFVGTVATGSRSPARSVTCLGGGDVLVAKRGDDLLTRMRLDDGTIEWSAPVPKASHAGVDCSVGPPCTVHVMGEADNHVLVLDADQGTLLARRAFDLLPGRVDAPDKILDRTGLQGAAWYAADNAVPRLAIVVGAPRGVIRTPVTAQRGSGLFPSYTQSDAVAVIPGVTGKYAMVLDDLSFDGLALSSTAQLGLDAPNPYAHAATSAGLETLNYSTAALAGLSDVADAEFYSLGRLPDDRIYAALWDATSSDVRVWTTAQATQGDPAGATWTPPTAYGGMGMAAVLDGELWAFWWDITGDLELHATKLVPRTTSIVAVSGSDFVVSDPFYSVLAVSPNGRTFVSWDLQPFSLDTSVVVWSASGGDGFPRRATVPVQGQVSGVAFDGTGEVLYVVTRGPDRILVLE